MGFKPRRKTASAPPDVRAMSVDEFWHVIELAGQRARRADGNDDQERFEAALKDILRERGPNVVVAFAHHFDERMREAYHYDLWDAVYLVNRGCGDDGFHDFRAWLVSMGRAVFEQAVQTPDSLARLLEQPDTWLGFHEGLSGLADRLYEEMTGQTFPAAPWRPYPDPPPGIRYDEDNMDFERRFPALWTLFGKYWTRSADQ